MAKVISCPRCLHEWPLAQDPARQVVCPTCHAAVGHPCKRPSGHALWGGQVHAPRDLLALELGHYAHPPCPGPASTPEPHPAPPAVNQLPLPLS